MNMSVGYRDLACQILVQTYNDLNAPADRGGQYFRVRQEALSFLYTEWFETLCNCIDLDPSYVRREMLRALAPADGRKTSAR